MIDDLVSGVVPSYDAAPTFISDFVAPLIRGARITLSAPLTKEALEGALFGVVSRDRYTNNLQLEIGQRARRIVADPGLIELRPSDLRLLAVAHQVLWFFHSAAESGKLWRRRQANLLEDAEALLESVGAPETTGQILARHVMLRHLPRLVRTDLRLEFGVLWSDLRFFGQPAHWTHYPLRSDPIVDTRQTLINERIVEKPSNDLYIKLFQCSPLTNLVCADLLYPSSCLVGALPALAVPSLCRFVTSKMLGDDLKRYMAPLARSMMELVAHRDTPLAERRNAARFILNLIATHAAVSSEADLLVLPEMARGPQPSRSSADLTAHQQQALASAGEDGATFFAIGRVLMDLRGPLGAAHLFSESAIADRVTRFLAPDGVDLGPLLPRITNSLREGLQYSGVPLG